MIKRSVSALKVVKVEIMALRRVVKTRLSKSCIQYLSIIFRSDSKPLQNTLGL